MQLKILKKAVQLAVIFFITSCGSSNSIENQIDIKINCIDKLTKKFRINTFDTIEVRGESTGYLTKSYPVLNKYITNSSGFIQIKIDSTKRYKFMIAKKGFYGSESFLTEKLKNGQEINIEVFSIEN